MINADLILYIKSAFAQAEALAGSKRVSMANRMRAECGNYVFVTAPFGYRIEDNNLIPVPEQAEVVVKIYQKYLSGVGMGKIAAELNADPDMIGKPWGKEGVRYILSNEKYTGDSLFQKTYSTDVFGVWSVKSPPGRKFLPGGLHCEGLFVFHISFRHTLF